MTTSALPPAPHNARNESRPESRPESRGIPRRGLRETIACKGVGLHSGAPVELRVGPAPAGTGIVFRRTDLGADIPARAENVVDSRLCTVLGLPDRPEAIVATVEHLMAAFAALRIDDALVEVTAPELPILDGSAEPFLALLAAAGIVETAGAREILEILRPVRVEHGDAFAELRPSTESPAFDPAPAFDLSLAIDFAASAIGRQAYSLRLSAQSFAEELARARTFTLAAEIEALRAAGLAKGGSLANAVVVDGATILNPEGLRYRDEFVRHKLLDVVGDLALLGAPIAGRFFGNRTGHALNNKLARAVLADPANHRRVKPGLPGGALTLPAAAAAA